MKGSLLTRSKKINYLDGHIVSSECRRLYGVKDENDIIFKRYDYLVTMKILNNGNILVEHFLNGQPHSNTSSAVFEYDCETDELINEKYYLTDGECRDRDFWLNRRDRTYPEPFEDMVEELYQEMGM